MIKPLMTADELRKVLDYDAETGVFRWRATRGPCIAGSVAGTIRADGRIHIHTHGRVQAAHRLAWLWIYSEWPLHEIDHINGNPSDNRICNLRDVPSAINRQNVRKAQNRPRSSPLLGAQWCKDVGKWKSSIRVNGRIKHIGFFGSDAEASAAYIAAKRVLHEGCTL